MRHERLVMLPNLVLGHIAGTFFPLQPGSADISSPITPTSYLPDLNASGRIRKLVMFLVRAAKIKQTLHNYVIMLRPHFKQLSDMEISDISFHHIKKNLSEKRKC